MPGFVIPAVGFAPVGGNSPPALGRRDFYYTYTWEIIGLFIDGAAPPLDGSNPLIYLKDLTLPTFTANTDSLTASSLEYKWAKGVVWEDVKVSWYDTKGLIDVLKRWRQSVWTPDTGLQVGSVYKKRSELAQIHLPTFNEDDSVRWRLFNSWPKVIKHGELTYTNSDVKLVEVTIAYDWAEEKSPTPGAAR